MASKNRRGRPRIPRTVDEVIDDFVRAFDKTDGKTKRGKVDLAILACWFRYRIARFDAKWKLGA